MVKLWVKCLYYIEYSMKAFNKQYCDNFHEISWTHLQTTASWTFDIAIDISELIVFHSGQTVRLTFSSRKWFKYSFERGWAGSGPFHERMMDN